MSTSLFPDDVLFEQRLLACGGFYEGKLDGSYGPKTMLAEQQSNEAYKKLAGGFLFDVRSERCIMTLLPQMQEKARAIMQLAHTRRIQTGMTCIILSGTRTYAEQNALFTKRPKVTNARGGQSNHNFGIAIDIGLFQAGRYLTGASKAENDAYISFAQTVKKEVPGIEWGGDWKSFRDLPHFQLTTGLTLAQVRSRFEKGVLLR